MTEMIEATGAAEIARLASELRAIRDRQELAHLAARLGVLMDDKRFDDLGSIYAEDATAATPGGTAQGVAGLIAQARRNHQGFARTQHVITNPLVELDGDRATVQANLVVTFVQRSDALEPHFTLGARYRFEAKRTEQGWRFSRVEVTPVWRADMGEGAGPTQR